MCYFSPRKQLEFSATKLCNECFAFMHIVFLSKWGQLCFCQHSWFWNKSNCFKPACGEKWHILKMILSQPNPRIKTPLSNSNKIVKNDVLNWHVDYFESKVNKSNVPNMILWRVSSQKQRTVMINFCKFEIPVYSLLADWIKLLIVIRNWEHSNFMILLIISSKIYQPWLLL